MTTRPITIESNWQAWLSTAAARPFPIQHYRHAVVIAAHPDDETLGASGLLQQLHEHGTRVSLVIASDGEAAFPWLPAVERTELGRRRRQELCAALHAQGLDDMPVHWLGLPDSDLAAHRRELTERLAESLVDADLCLAPWPADPHPDHQTVGEVALRVAPDGAHRWSYPIWMWHWREPDDANIPLSQAFTYQLTPAQRHRKTTAIASFTSQLEPNPKGGEAILTTAMLEHFARDVEVVFHHPPERSAPISRFAQLYQQHGDPWHVSDSWYEQRKRGIIMSSLPRERYELAIEPACGTGALTEELAARCDQVIAFDAVVAAVGQAGTRIATRNNVRLDVATLPDGLPTEPADLVLLSEILYYLGDQDLASTVDRAIAALRPGGHLLAAHWLPWAPEAPRNGMDAHRILLARPELQLLVEHVDQSFVLHVLGRR